MPVAGLSADREVFPVRGDGLVELPRFVQRRAEVVQRVGFAVPVAGLAVDRGGVLVGGDGLVEPPRSGQGQAEVVQRGALAD